MAESIITDTDSEKAATGQYVWGTGKRKCSIARVRIKPGKGAIEVNGKTPSDYFTRQGQIAVALSPLKITEREGKYDVFARTHGGGIAGQADAVMLGIARALEKAEPDLRSALRDAGCLTRDSRIKERKKYGQKRARKKFQFSKR
jgi:small subunit ribosomal protein S9